MRYIFKTLIDGEIKMKQLIAIVNILYVFISYGQSWNVNTMLCDNPIHAYNHASDINILNKNNNNPSFSGNDFLKGNV